MTKVACLLWRERSAPYRGHVRTFYQRRTTDFVSGNHGNPNSMKTHVHCGISIMRGNRRVTAMDPFRAFQGLQRPTVVSTTRRSVADA